MANNPTIKEPTGVVSGGSQKWGGPDAVHAAQLLKGTHGSEKIQPVAIDTLAKIKIDATIAPTVNNDITEGYTEGSLWIDVTADIGYICLDNTDGAAVWINITAGAAGGEVNTISSIGGGTADLVAGTPKSGLDLRTKTLSVSGLITLGDSGDILTIGTTATANQSDAEIKTAYENNANTNEFSDAEQSKLSALITDAIANLVEDTTPVLGGNLDADGKDIVNIQNLIHDISISGTDIDFAEDELQTISITTNTTFTTINRLAGKSKVVKIITDGTLRTLAFPAWDWVSAIPADQAASKNGYLTLTSFGTTDALIVASYAVGSL